MRYSLFFTSTISLLLLISYTSCRKKDDHCKPKKDPCDNAVLMEALNSEPYSSHFRREDHTGMKYYRAVNYREYASQIIPGENYEIAFMETECDFMPCTGNKVGNCFGLMDYTCIKIICLKKLQKTCFSSVLEGNGCFGRYYSVKPTMFENPYIAGRSLNARVTYSGCSENGLLDYQLYTKLNMYKCPGPDDEVVINAKIEKMDNGFTCMAVFKRDMCFDLNTICNYYTENNWPLPKVINISLESGSSYTTLKFYP